MEQWSNDLRYQNNDYRLVTAVDLNKDQSYFLYNLRGEQLEHILFSIGDFYKSEVREIARLNELKVAEKKDSMGVCFLGNVRVRDLLQKRLGKRLGEVRLRDGTVVGEHDGHWFFTVGERGRWRIKNQISNIKNQKSEMRKQKSEYRNPKQVPNYKLPFSSAGRQITNKKALKHENPPSPKATQGYGKKQEASYQLLATRFWGEE